MNDRDSLLSAIIQQPEEDTPRLAFADWLDEHGEANRAEFIRAQHKLIGLPLKSDERVRLETRTAELLTKHRKIWAADVYRVMGSSARLGWRRGFPEGVTGYFEHLIDRMDRLPKVMPLTAMRLQRDYPLPSLHVRDVLQPIKHIIIDPAETRHQLHDPSEPIVLNAFPNVTSCKISKRGTDKLGIRGTRTFSQRPLPASLKVLDFEGQDVKDAGVELLLGSAWIDQVRGLMLNDNQLTDRALEIIRGNRQRIVGLEHLDISGNMKITDEATLKTAEALPLLYSMKTRTTISGKVQRALRELLASRPKPYDAIPFERTYYWE
jgi:uncharacterized protein (TIGR02996 family)